jgi:hypothetical protein
MLAPDTVTAERLRKLEALAAQPGTAGEGATANREGPPKSDLITARLFGPVEFASGLSTAFLSGRYPGQGVAR